MLGSPMLYLKGMRIVTFQLSGFNPKGSFTGPFNGSSKGFFKGSFKGLGFRGSFKVLGFTFYSKPQEARAPNRKSCYTRP